ncbi:MAG: hypothetical protein RLY21_2407 [Planctomycetota bacterium]
MQLDRVSVAGKLLSRTFHALMATLLAAGATAPALSAADLVPNSVSGPATALEASIVTVSWTVTNSGDETVSGTWTDRLLLSDDSSIGGDRVLANVNITATLAPGQSYTRSRDVMLPQGQVGTQRFVVDVDTANFVAKSDETNNALIATMPISITPAFSDLVATTVSGPSFAAAGETVAINFTVVNQGTVSTGSSYNYYQLLASVDAIAGNADDVPVTGVFSSFDGIIAPGQVRTQTIFLSVPSSTPANVRWVARVDPWSFRYEGPLGELNDATLGTSSTIGTADIGLAVATPSATYPGGMLDFSYTYTNSGPGSVSPQVTNAFSLNSVVVQGYLSTDETLDAGDIEIIYRDDAASLLYSGAASGLQPGESVTVNGIANLPVSVPLGTYRLIMAVDRADELDFGVDAIHELPAVDREIWASDPFEITDETPDLVATAVTGPATTSAGAAVSVSFTLTNQGASPVEDSVSHQIVASLDDEIGNEDDIVVADFANLSVALDPGESGLFSVPFRIPSNVPASVRWGVRLDRNDWIAEGAKGEQNNLALGNTASIGLADVAIAISTPTNAYPGAYVNFGYAYSNAGPGSVYPRIDGTFYLQVQTRAYLSLDDTLDSSDIEILVWQNDEYDLYFSGSVLGLQPGETVPISTWANIPDDIAPGSWRLLVAIDRADNIDPNGIDAIAETLKTDQEIWASAPFTIAASYADLVVSDVTGPKSALSGATVTVTYTVTNVGTLPVYQRNDQIFASLDSTAGNSDDVVIARYNPSYDFIAPGSSATRTVEFTIPSNTPDAIQWGVTVDADNWLNEGAAGEANNQSLGNQAAIEPADITVAVANPGDQYPGARFDLRYTYTNIGAGSVAPIDGWSLLPVRADAYLSADTTLDKGDTLLFGNRDDEWLLAYSGDDFGLQPGESIESSSWVQLPSTLATGSNYHILVAVDRADDNGLGGDAIFETPKSNQEIWASAPFAITEEKPDLVVSNIAVTPATYAGDEVVVSYTITNQGSRASSESRGDQIFALVGASADNKGTAVELSSDFYFADAIPAGASADFSVTLVLPSWTPGSFQWQVVTDVYDDTVEGTKGEANNAAKGPAASISANDIEVAVRQPETLAPGSYIEVRYIYSNLGLSTVLPALSPYMVSRPVVSRIFASADGVLDASDVLLTVANDTDALVSSGSEVGLQPNESVERSLYASIPSNAPTNLTRLIVAIDQADADGGVDAIREPVGSDNEVFLSIDPMAGDLLVDSVSLTPSAKNPDSIEVEWTVRNGGTTPLAGLWYDEVLLSTDALEGNDIPLGNFTRPNGLDPSETYTQTETVTLPAGAGTGSFYILVKTDASDFVVEPSESNNLASASSFSGGLIAELSVTTASAPASALLGESIVVDWTVGNSGTATAVAPWIDSVWLSNDSVLGPGDTMLTTVPRSASLSPTESYIQSTSVTVPITASAGTKYLFVLADSGNSVPEADDANNASASIAVAFAEPPLPDLVSTAAEPLPPATESTGAPLSVFWSTANNGTATAAGGWYESLRAINQSTLAVTTLSDYYEWSPILPSQSRSRAAYINLYLAPGTYTLVVDADAYGWVTEGAAGETNNRLTLGTLTVLAPDLFAQSASFPTTQVAGRPMSGTWQIGNNGPGAWWPGAESVVYLSTDGSLDAGDRYLGSTVNLGNGLLPGSTVNANWSGAVPFDVTPGVYRILVATDRFNYLEESNEANNLLDAGPITVTEPQYANIVSSGITAPAQAAAGDYISIYWTDTNIGVGSTQTSYTDRVYLSSDNVFDGSDLYVGYGNNWYDLLPGQSTAVGAGAYMPSTPGTYYIFIVSDYWDNVPEGPGESDNVSAAGGPISVGTVDLVASALSIPTVVEAGAPLSATWTTQNLGSVTTAGAWYDSLRFFTTPTGTSYYEAGYLYINSPLAPAESAERTISTTVPNLYGTFYARAVADSYGYVAESDEANNRSDAIAVEFRAADLVVTSPSVPTSVAPGDAGTIAWTVQNAGNGTSYGSCWYDRLYLSTNTTIENGDIEIGSNWFCPYNIASGASVAASLNYVIPFTVAPGTYNIILQLDAFNNRFESNDENNVFVAGTVTVAPATYPNLVVSNVTVSPSATLGGTVDVSWTVTNTGDRATTGGFYDRVVFSTDATFGGDTNAGDFGTFDSLAVGASVTQTRTINAPGSTGSFYVFVQSDIYGNANEGTNEGDNVSAPAGPFAVGAPNLVVSDVTVSPSTTLGGTVDVSWTVTNTGDRATLGGFYDRVVFSTDATLGGDTNAGDFGTFDSLAAGASVTQARTISAPGSIGSFYVFVQSDIYGSVNEGANEGDNTSTAAGPVSVGAANLVVSAATAPSEATVGGTIELSWTVNNAGDRATTSTVVDRVILSTDAVLGGDTVVGDYSDPTLLASGASYTRTRSISVPSTTGPVYFFVQTDVYNNTNEGTNETDNFSTPIGPVTIGTPDLVVNAITAPATLSAGAPVTVSWSITNQGDRATLGPWLDSARFTDSAVGGAEIGSIGNVSSGGTLAAGATVSPSASSIVPNFIGDAFVRVTTDAGAAITEASGEANNALALPVAIVAGDLVAANLSAPSSIEQLVPATISWSTTNSGAGDSYGGCWISSAYLSADSEIGTGDLMLGSVTECSSPLAAGASVTHTVTPTLPITFAPGTYNIIVATDSGGVRFESNDANNTAILGTVEVVAATKPNLVVTAVALPSEGTVGSNINLSYTVTNTGTRTTTAASIDRVFVSTDNLFGGDTDAGNFSGSELLAPGASYTRNAVIAAPSTTGPIYIFVQADVYNAIDEGSDEGDNVSAAAGPIAIGAPDLIVSAVTAPSAADAGSTVTVNWTVQNQGDRAALVGWTDFVRMYDAASGGNPVDFGSTYFSFTGLAPGASSERSGSYAIPNVSGTYYLRVTADGFSVIPEGANESNNSLTIPITVRAADLVATGLSAPSSIEQLVPATISWSTSNSGEGASLGTCFTSRAYLSADTVIGTGDYMLGSSSSCVSPLAAGATVPHSVNPILPQTFAPGVYNIIVVTDFDNTRFESDEVNNIAVLGTVTVAPATFPNLVVTSVLVPSEATIGGTIDISWTVTNTGDRATIVPSTDRVFLSADATFGGDTTIGDYSDSSLLAPGASYTRTRTVSAPTTTGAIYFFVQTDVAGSIGESTNEGDNVSAAAGPIAVSAPDLVVNAINVPAAFDAGAPLTVEWTVANQGDRATLSAWSDRVRFHDPDTGLEVAPFAITPSGSTLAAAGSLTRSASGTTPNLNGTLSLRVATDTFNAVAEAGNESNNELSVPVTIRTADLVVTGVSVPSSIEQLVPTAISWSTTNSGAGASYGGCWTTRAYLSTDTSIDAGDYLLASDALCTSPFAAGASASHSMQVTLPQSLAAGTYNLLIVTDAANSRFESDEANNTSSAGTVTVTPATFPNLVVTSVLVPSEATVGGTIEVSWTVTNTGDRATIVAAADRLFLSTDAAFGGDTTIGDYSDATTLAAGASYTRTRTVSAPTTTGAIYFFVQTDIFNAIGESANEGDNVSTAAGPVAVGAPDLVVSAIDVPATINAGAPITVNWTGANQGDRTTLAAWLDAARLVDSATGGTPIAFFGNASSSGALAPSATASRTVSGTVPNLVGSAFVRVTTDDTNTVAEAGGESNNSLTVPVTVIAGDLVATGVSVPSTVEQLQPATVSWSTTNSGAGDSYGACWGSSAYLSADATLDAGDYLLGNVSNCTSPFAAGASVAHSIPFTLPQSLAAGTYNLIIATDTAGVRFESDESNNTAVAGSVTVTPATFPNLVVTSVLVPSEATVGGTMEISWTVTNTGNRATTVASTDRLYLSTDDVFGGDTTIGNYSDAVTLVAGASYTRTRTISAPAATGPTYVFIETDVGNAIGESTNEGDNVSAAAGPISVGAPDLVITAIEVPATINAGAPFTANWTNANQGDRSTLASWVDAARLADSASGGNEIGFIGNVASSDALAPSATATRTATATVPNFVGNAFVRVTTDLNNTVAEASGESNNLLAVPVTVVAGDLVASGAVIPSSIEQLVPAVIDWSTTNTGLGSSYGGCWTSRAYLSADATLDAGDYLLGSSSACTSPLAPGANASHSASFTLPDTVPAGTYSVIVQTDATSARFESDESNNTAVVGTVVITVATTPNLVVSAVSAPSELVIGNTFELGWTVSNIGGDPLPAGTQWRDRVVQSANAVFGDADDTTVAIVVANGPLAAGSSRSLKRTLTVPSTDGTYHYFVRTDDSNQTSEYNGEADNVSAPAGPIVVEWPDRPDLVVSAISAPSTATSTQLMSVSYSVTNNGETPATGLWKDSIAISLDGVETVVGQFYRVGPIAAGATVNYNAAVAVPLSLIGTANVVARVDVDSQIDEGAPSREANNSRTTDTPTEIGEPSLANLQIASVAVVPSSGTAFTEGGSAVVSWTGTNAGTLATTGTFVDRVYLSADATFGAGDALLGSYIQGGSVPPAGNWTRSLPVTLPAGPTPAFVIVVADALDAVEEGTRENDNSRATDAAIVIEPAARPDLVAAITGTPATWQAGSSAQVSWSITNQGAASASGPWTDGAYLSTDATLTAADIPLRLQPYSLALAPTASYSRSVSVELPTDYEGGPRYLIVRTDINGVVEQAGSGADIAVFGPFNLLPTPAADLVPSAVGLATATPTFGAPITVNWTESNTGTLAASTAWTDLVLLARTPTPSALDVPVGILPSGGATIAPSGSIARTVTTTLPLTNELTEGQYWIVVRADANGSLEEKSDTNNTAVFGPVTIARPPLPNLTASVISTPATAGPGAPFDVTLELRNDGAEPVVGNPFVSITMTGSGSPLLLQDFLVSVDLDPGETKLVTRSVSLPVTSSEQIVLRACADSREQIVESVEVDNCADSTPITMQRADLVAVSVSAPPSGIAGTPLTLSYSVRNDGNTSAVGFWTESIYLSTDDVLGDDRLVGSVTVTSALAVGATANRVQTVSVPADIEGVKFVIVTTNASNTLPEPNTANNTAVSSTPVVIEGAPRANLVVDAVTAPATGIAGSTVSIGYTVRNASTTTDASGQWIDAVYLSTNDVFGPDDILLGQKPRTTPLAADASYSDSVSVTLPGTAGTYRVIVVTDAFNNLSETSPSGEGDNSRLAPGLLGIAGVEATVSAAVEKSTLGQPIALTGLATVAGSGATAPNARVRVRTFVRGTATDTLVTTGADGSFALSITPTPGVAGLYGFGAGVAGGDAPTVQDQVLVVGLAITLDQSTITVAQGSGTSGVLTVQNLSDLPASGFAASVLSTAPGVDIQLFVPGSDVLGPLETRAIPYTATALPAAEDGSATFSAVIDDLGIQQRVATVNVVPLESDLVITPTPLVKDMLVGTTTYVAVTLRNAGQLATGPIRLQISSAPWLSLVSPATLAPLAPGAEASIQIRLSPDDDLPLGPYSATPFLVATDLSNSSSSASVNGVFNAISDEFGSLKVMARNEFSYYGTPPTYPNALVELRRAGESTLLASGTVDAQGEIVFEKLPAGLYEIRSTAPQHGGFTQVRRVDPGQNEIVAFMARQLVTYQWSVVPIPFSDRYEITLNFIFETNVPAPVITVDPPFIDFTTMQSPTEYREVRIKNHGLVTALDVEWAWSNTARYEIVPLYSSMGDLLPGETKILPILLVDNGPSAGSGAIAECLAPALKALWKLLCDRLRQNDLTVPVRIDPAEFDPCGLGGLGGFGGGGGGGGNGGGGNGGETGPGGLSQPGGNGQAVNLCCNDACGPALIDGLLGLHSYTSLPGLGDVVGGACGAANACACAFGGAGGGGGEDDGPLGEHADFICDALGEAADQLGGDDLQFGASDDTDQIVWEFPMPLANNWQGRDLRDAVKRYWESQVPKWYRFGRPHWVYYGVNDEAPLFEIVNAMIAAGELGSSGGEQIDATEAAAILALPKPGNLNDSRVTRAIDRWNRSLEYYANGWTTRDDVPEGMSIDFIDQEVAAEFEARAEEIRTSWEALGFNDESDELFAAIDLYIDRINNASSSQDGQGQCVTVAVQLNQTLTLVRQAFAATLSLENGTGSAMEALGIDLRIQDTTGADARSKFAILGPDLTGLNDVSGNGVLAPGGEGSAQWTIVPGDSAAPAGPTVYTVSGTMSYSSNGNVIAIPLFPVAITVYPNASLSLQYFLETQVYSDDPFTPEIEPTVPFSLGLWAKNSGGGTAGSVQIESAQPVITENETGALIDFQLIGTQVNDTPVSPSLLVNFGDILPGEVSVAQWLMTSSLQGQFTEYSATVSSVNGFNDPEFSIVDEAAVNPMVHVVRADVPLDDGRPDFLARPDDAEETLPNRVFLSTGAVEPVTADTNPSVSVSGLVATVTVPELLGWRYIRVEDPFACSRPITSVVRSDGKVLRLGDNAWQTSYITRDTPEPEARRFLHLFDRGGTGVYTVTYASDSTPPEVLSWQIMKPHGIDPYSIEASSGAATSEPRSGGITKLTLSFSEPIDPESFGPVDVVVTAYNASGVEVDVPVADRTVTLRLGDQYADIEFPTPLPDARRYCIRLVGATDLAGNLIDQDSGSIDLVVLAGDVTGDLRVTVNDAGAIGSLVGATFDPLNPYHVRSDVNRDGAITMADANLVVAAIGRDFRFAVNPCTDLSSGFRIAPSDNGGGNGDGAQAGTADGGIARGGVGATGRGGSFASAGRGKGNIPVAQVAGATVRGEERIDLIALRPARDGSNANAATVAFAAALFGLAEAVPAVDEGGWAAYVLPEIARSDAAREALALLLANEAIECADVLLVDDGASVEPRLVAVVPEITIAWREIMPATWRDEIVARTLSSAGISSYGLTAVGDRTTVSVAPLRGNALYALFNRFAKRTECREVSLRLEPIGVEGPEQSEPDSESASEPGAETETEARAASIPAVSEQEAMQ